jgi:uncharacterized protein (UPF0548 family)
MVLPRRAVYCTDEATSFGSAYGTMPGHPERDEEPFHVRLDDQGVVSFHLVAFSRPNDLATRGLGPRDLRPVDGDTPLRGYTNSMKRHVRSAVNSR